MKAVVPVAGDWYSAELVQARSAGADRIDRAALPWGCALEDVLAVGGRR